MSMGARAHPTKFSPPLRSSDNSAGTPRAGRWALILVGVLLAGCASPPPPPAPSTPVTQTTPTPVFAIAAGDCLGVLDFKAPDALLQVAAVPCKTPHAWQVASILDLNETQYPGAETLKAEAITQCARAFKAFIGVEVDYSRYSSAYLAPDGPAWTNPEDRKIVCLAGDPDGNLTRSIKGDAAIFPQVGQCTGPQNVPPAQVHILPCTEKHNYEVYAQQKITGKTPPTQAEINKLVDDVCVAQFEKFIGLPVATSSYEYTWFVADAGLWTKVADHRIVCSVGLPKGGIVGTLAGAKK